MTKSDPESIALTTRPPRPCVNVWIKVYINIKIFRADVFNARKLSSKSYLPLMGLEPTTSELEVQRAIRCATVA